MIWNKNRFGHTGAVWELGTGLCMDPLARALARAKVRIQWDRSGLRR